MAGCVLKSGSTGACVLMSFVVYFIRSIARVPSLISFSVVPLSKVHDTVVFTEEVALEICESLSLMASKTERTSFASV